MHIDYKTRGVCSSWIHFDLDDQQCITNVSFDGGCNGNLKAISKLVEGQPASRIAEILEGNTCGFKAHQLRGPAVQSAEGSNREFRGIIRTY